MTVVPNVVNSHNNGLLLYNLMYVYNIHNTSYVCNVPPYNFHSQAGAHPASYPVGTRVLSCVVKRLGCEADHSPPSAEVVNMWRYTSIPPYVSLLWNQAVGGTHVLISQNCMKAAMLVLLMTGD
jgi:hypothetical protein